MNAVEILRFATAAGKFASAGFPLSPPDFIATRKATCRACPKWDSAAFNGTGRCKKCGCSTWAKLRMATEACPLGKWEAASDIIQESTPEQETTKQ